MGISLAQLGFGGRLNLTLPLHSVNPYDQGEQNELTSRRNNEPLRNFNNFTTEDTRPDFVFKLQSVYILAIVIKNLY